MSDRASNILGALALAIVDRIDSLSTELLRQRGQGPAALVIIGYANGLSIDTLRRILGLSHPGAVRLVDRLAVEGLAERRPGPDGRTVSVHLTDAGLSAREALLKGRLAALNSILAALSQEELDQLSSLSTRVLESLETTDIDRYKICRLCDDRVCPNCPLPTRKGSPD